MVPFCIYDEDHFVKLSSLAKLPTPRVKQNMFNSNRIYFKMSFIENTLDGRHIPPKFEHTSRIFPESINGTKN